jgi:D-3-phosphoglycerate dehydrogenase
MRILIAEKFEQSGIDGLRRLGCDVAVNADVATEALPALVKSEDPDILVVRGKKVPEPVFDAGSKLSLVIRAGAGYDTIDVAAASARGIIVANCPGKNSIAVAELAWALILACDRRVPDQVAELRQKKWNKKEYSKAAGLFGRTLGIVGFGQIGQEVMKRGKAFGMNVIAWSRSLTPERAEELEIEHAATPVELAQRSDVISIHVAATSDTRHLVNRAFCEAMRPGAIVINTSRGSVVEEEALATAIRTKGVRAGLDVFANEPSGPTGEFTDGIVSEPGVYGTHHIGASTDQAQQAIAEETVRIVQHLLRTGQVLNAVNVARSTPATNVLTVRMLNRPGVLAHVFYILGQAGINVEEMSNVIYEGAKAASAHIQLDDAPHAELLTAIRANPSVISASVSRL